MRNQTLRYSFTAENAKAIPLIAKLLPALASGPDDDPGTLSLRIRRLAPRYCDGLEPIADLNSSCGVSVGDI
jgi:hypothetical protein